jgi:uncharacterized oxidoreductase
MRSKDNTIAITGGSSGIGAELAVRLAKAGNRVIISGRRADRLAEVAPGISTRLCDVADEGQRADLVSWLAKTHPETNVFINNAGVQMSGNFMTGLDTTKMRTEIETNVVALFHLCDLASRLVAGKEGATIVNVSSGLAFTPLAFLPVYCATKAAVHSFTLSLRHQLRAKGVEVVEIIPPAVDTELGHDRRAGAPTPAASHGGMPVKEFVDEVFKGFEAGLPEIAVGGAVDLRANGEKAFEGMNSRR